MSDNPIWITRLEPKSGGKGALAGLSFAVKDNIDVAGVPTTAGCPAFAYTPQVSASVVQNLEAAGAVLAGKTNLDQFATGLVGTRSPFGACHSVFNAAFISGGSSSGSAVAVAAGLVDFALGTDTAGSGRVPAAFNNIIGLKPTRGLIGLSGIVPACRTLDCVSIFARTVTLARRVLDVLNVFDPADPFARPARAALSFGATPRIGVPREPLEFFGDEDCLRLGARLVPIDFSPFAAAARLLYAGPWVGERLAALRGYGFDRPEMMEPSVRAIIYGAQALSAVDSFEAQYQLARYIRAAEAAWAEIDALLLPTTPTIYRIDEVQADPIRLNSNLGLYTNFVNLMDLCAIAVPAGFRQDGLPLGVSFIGRAFQDSAIAALAEGFLEAAAPKARLAVVGAHLSGQPLNWQLRQRGARLLKTARTASGYRLYALAGQTPPKPGLIFDGSGAGGIEVEIWDMDMSAFGGFVAAIPAPLGIGTLRLDDGAPVQGFLCEAHGLAGARDITEFGGWRRFLDASC